MASRTPASILNRVTDLSTETITRRVIALTYGDSGVGKTVLTAGEAQALKGDGRILWLDSSDGYVTLEDWREEGLLDDVDYLSVPDWQDLPALADMMVKRQKAAKIDMGNTTVLVLDESSSWFMDMLHESAREAEGLKPSDPLPEIEGRHYQRPTQAFLSIISTFMKRPDVHLLLVSHEQERGKTEQSAKIGPSLPPAFLKGVNQKMHLIARVENVITADGYRRTVQVQPSRKVAAKSRIRDIGPMVDFSDLPSILADWATSGAFDADMLEPEDQILYEDVDITVPETEAVEEAVEVD